MTDDFFGSEAEDLGFEVDTTDVDDESLYRGGGVQKEGFYHVSAEDIVKEDQDGKLPCLKISLKVHDGTEKSEINKILTHRIYLKAWEDKEAGIMKPLDKDAQDRITKFARAFNLVKEADFGKKNVKISFHQIRGRQAVVEVRQESDYTDHQGKTRKGQFRIPFNNAYYIGHEKVKDVPKDPEILALAGVEAEAVGAGSSGGGGSAGSSDLDDI